MASRLTGRPVRLTHPRRDEFIAARHRAKTQHRLRAGIRKDGSLTLLYHKTIGQEGADPLLAGTSAANDFTPRLYRCENVRTEAYQVFTNTQNPVSFRGPCVAEELFCLEVFIDELAHLARMDPLDFRIHNYADLDQVDGLPYSSKGLNACYESGARQFGWNWTPPQAKHEVKRRGIGMSSVIFHGLEYEQSQALIRMNADGTANVVAGVSEFGTGVETILAQIAAEETGLRLEDVVVTLGESNFPYSIDSSYGSRTTALVGPSVRTAAAQAKEQLLAAAAASGPGAEASELYIEDSMIRSHRDSAFAMPVSRLTAAMGREQIVCLGNRHPAMPNARVHPFAAHFVEVEVDTETGQVRVIRAVCAHDSGRWMNPLLMESQIQGGFIQGMGMALFDARSPQEP